MIASLGSGNNRFFLGLAIILAGAGVLAVVLWSTGRPDVTSGSEQQRAAAVIRIANQRPLGARDSLSTAAQDESPIVRRAAIVGLTQMMASEGRPVIEKDRPVVEKDRLVIEKAVRDKDSIVRAVAAESLGKFNDAPATAELIRLLETDPDASVRIAALRGLVDCDDPRAIVAMVETAGKDASYEIRLQAGRSALRKAGGRLLPDRNPDNDVLWRELIQLLKSDKRIRLAYAAAGATLIDHPEDAVTRSHLDPQMLPAGVPATRLAPGKLK
jgi:HEAT repeat protein